VAKLTGDRLIEATAAILALLSDGCAIKGYKMTLIMPDNMSAEVKLR